MVFCSRRQNSATLQYRIARNKKKVLRWNHHSRFGQFLAQSCPEPLCLKGVKFGRKLTKTDKKLFYSSPYTDSSEYAMYRKKSSSWCSWYKEPMVAEVGGITLFTKKKSASSGLRLILFLGFQVVDFEDSVIRDPCTQCTT